MKAKRTSTDHRSSIIVRNDKGQFTARSTPRKKKPAATDVGPALVRAWDKHQRRLGEN